MTESYTKELKEALDKSGLTQKQLAEKTGISQKQISQYMHGVIPGASNQKKIQEVLEEQRFNRDEDKTEALKIAAKKLGMSLDSLKICLIKDLIKPQIGVAIPSGNRWRYTIFENRLNKYLEGADF